MHKRGSQPCSLPSGDIRTTKRTKVKDVPRCVSTRQAEFVINDAKDVISTAHTVLESVSKVDLACNLALLIPSLMSVLINLGRVKMVLATVESLLLPTAATRVHTPETGERFLVLRVMQSQKTVTRGFNVTKTDGSLVAKHIPSAVCVVLAARGMRLGTIAVQTTTWGAVEVEEAVAIAKACALPAGSPSVAVHRATFHNHADACNCNRCEFRCWTPMTTAQPSRMSNVELQRNLVYIADVKGHNEPTDVFTGLRVLNGKKGQLVCAADKSSFVLMTREFAAAMAKSVGHGPTSSGVSRAGKSTYRMETATRAFIAESMAAKAAMRVSVDTVSGLALARVVSKDSSAANAMLREGATIKQVLETSSEAACPMCETSSLVGSAVFFNVKRGVLVCSKHAGCEGVVPLVDTTSHERMWTT